MPTRSKAMNKLLSDFSDFKRETNNLADNEEGVEDAINQVNNFGGVIGKLHVSCCGW
jgi:cytochrome c556